jgi:hypothetical protein
MYAVEDKEADSRVQQHDQVVQIIEKIAAQVKNRRDHSADEEKREPDPEPRLHRRVADDLIIYEQKDSPQEQYRQQNIHKDQERRDIAQEETDDIAAPEK